MKLPTFFSRFSRHIGRISLIGALALAASVSRAQVSYTGGTYSQNFNTLASTGSGTTNVFTDNVTLPGWYAEAIDTTYDQSLVPAPTFVFTFAGTVNPQPNDYTAGTGSSNTGDLYSFGIAGVGAVTDRALGSVGSGTPDDFFIGVAVKNDTGAALASFTVSYDGEQWRLGGNTTQRAETVYAYYRVGGTAFDGSGTWTPVTGLNFTSPNTSATTTAGAALDGNDAVNRVALSTTISTPVQAGEIVWILWVDLDHPGSDHGMAIDNFIFTGASASAGTPVITSATSASVEANSPLSYFITASGSPTSFDATGLPAGLTVNTSTGEISGTPTVPGSYPVAISATNSVGTGAATLTLTISIDPDAPAISSGQTINAVINTPITPYQIVASGSPTSYGSGTLPAGLVLDTTSGIISGTPTVAGTFSNVAISATNTSGVGSGTIAIIIASPPVITSELSVSAYSGSTFTYTLTVTQGINSVVWTNLPSGVVDTTATVISGTPAPGSYTVGISATNDYGTTTATLKIMIVDPAAQSTTPASVVINKYVNGTPDKVELLVLGNGSAGSTTDLRGMILKDFSGSMVNDGGGKYEFATSSLWSAVPAGTLIVLSSGATEAEDLNAADFVLKVNLGNTAFFTLLGGTFDIAATEMVMIKPAGYGSLGVAGGLHVLANGTAGAQYTAFTGAKLIAAPVAGSNPGVIANNSTSSLADFVGTDATAGVALASLTFGAGNNTTNQTYIDSLRTVAHTALETWRFEKFGVYTDTGAVLAGDTEDYDGDGIANLLEYALSTNPTVANASVVTTAKAGDFLTLSFPVISDSSLTYTVQATSDLGVAFATGGGSTNEAGGVRTYTDNVSLSTAGVRRFLRLQVTRAE